MKELKKKIEAVLFAAGKYLPQDEIAAIVGSSQSDVKKALRELQVDFENNPHSSLIILNDGHLWKLTTREEYSRLVKSIVTQTELSKTLLF